MRGWWVENVEGGAGFVMIRANGDGGESTPPPRICRLIQIIQPGGEGGRVLGDERERRRWVNKQEERGNCGETGKAGSGG